MKIMMRASYWFLFLVIVLNGKDLFAREAYWEEHHIALSGLTEEQVRALESTIDQLKGLEPGELKINKKVYQRLSRFKELFGFSFQGKALADWLLARIKGISYHNSWTAAQNQNAGNFIIGEMFFTKLSTLERLYLLIHEARHSDKEGYDHVRCPKGFKTVSATQPDLDLEREPACDETREGAYSFQAAFLFELFAYGLFDQKEVGLLYNSSISRVIP